MVRIVPSGHRGPRAPSRCITEPSRLRYAAPAPALPPQHNEQLAAARSMPLIGAIALSYIDLERVIPAGIGFDACPGRSAVRSGALQTWDPG